MTEVAAGGHVTTFICKLIISVQSTKNHHLQYHKLCMRDEVVPNKLTPGLFLSRVSFKLIRNLEGEDAI